MESATQRISPLHRRMIDDMRMRELSDQTQRHYIRTVRQFLAVGSDELTSDCSDVIEERHIQ